MVPSFQRGSPGPGLALTALSTGEQGTVEPSLQHTGRREMALEGLGSREPVPCQVFVPGNAQ